MEYEWSSDLDGYLGNESILTVSVGELSIGQHTIGLRVMGKNGLWSETVTSTITIGRGRSDEEGSGGTDQFVVYVLPSMIVLFVVFVMIAVWPRGSSEPQEVVPVPQIAICPSCGSEGVFIQEYGRD